MISRLARLAVVAIAISASTAYAQQPKSGGILKMYHRETPPSMSIHEEATYLGQRLIDADLQQPGHV